ncbi:Cfr10I/Bse634I family restriction endonuclease [Geobacillus subterraneus]|uniref:BsrFI restriction endonuclease n=1 Tax=Geobacillus stearothermophilus TaxID=1422 RepID=Q9FDD9_GEOSE|nr:Cfr10I/Bse634I family restriction endonuclease [Geobacillus subterraneus]AAG01144.1 BsrFI restriction endonuclease [Geobacillus stearothermophilus]QIZ69143.1 Cfr10I/Bse634I family restriction endonuclease [Geobacillus subterraneus]
MMTELKNSNCIEEYQENGKTKVRIKPFNALIELYDNQIPTGNIKENLDKLQNYVMKVADAKGLTKPASAAFSNTRGTWFEVMIAIQSWNYRIKRGYNDYLIIKMPNVKTFDFRKIFDDETREKLYQLEKSLLTHKQQVRLITSNPDLLIIRQKDLIKDEYNQPIDKFTHENVDTALTLFKHLERKCKWDSLVAGIGLKTSLRPDRRLQLVHEGNILKSLFAHLKMRYWNPKAEFKYYGASSEPVSQADDDALQTAATHTIVNVNSTPERAVDDVFSLTSFEDIDKMLDQIIKK